MTMVERHDRELRALAYRLLGDRVAMDDVMQEAYLKAFRGLSSFRREAQPGTWLYRIVYNACLDHLRRERRAGEVPLEGVAEPVSPDDPSEEALERADLAGALAALPVEQRAAVMLVDAGGLSYEEAAEVLSVPPGTVASRLNHARSALRVTLVEGRGYGTVR